MHDSHDLESQVKSATQRFARSVNTRKDVSLDISELVEATRKIPLTNLDYWERLIRSEFCNTISISKPSKFKFWAKPSRILTWVDLISWDGQKRERALRTLSGAAPNSFFFTLAIRRLNDWVPQVRQAARESLPAIANSSDPTLIVDALCFTLSNWHSWGRIEQEDKDALLQIIANDKLSVPLRDKIVSSSSGPMTTLFSQLGRTPVLDDYFSEIAIRAVQPSVRAKAFRSQFDKRVVWNEGYRWEWVDKAYGVGKLAPINGVRKIAVDNSFSELLTTSAADSSSIVRRVAAEMLIRNLEHLDPALNQFAHLFAADKSLAVSERGKFALKKLKERQH